MAHGLHAVSVCADRAATERAAAERALMQGQIDEAVARAQRLAATDPKDGQAYLLMCRSFYAEAHTEEAIDACTKATESLPQSSEAQDWLGRASGMKAERAGPISGLSLALKVRAAFEAAVALDPGNGDAINDLGEFYIDAPVVIGGGLDKSAMLANQASRSAAASASHSSDGGGEAKGLWDGGAGVSGGRGGREQAGCMG